MRIARVPLYLVGILFAVVVLDCTSKSGLRADGDGDVTIEIPMPYDVVRSIVSTADVPDGATWDQLLDRAVVTKRVAPVRIYFQNAADVKYEHITELIKVQILPLLASVHETSGLKFDWVHDLNEADTVIVFADRASQGLAAIGEVRLVKWLGQPREEFDAGLETFRSDESECLGFTVAPGGIITRAVGFVSTGQSASSEENCIAKNLLYAIGLRGPADGPSARNLDYSSRTIDILDKLGLQTIYGRNVQPGIKLREVIEVKSDE
ncbi:MAG: hypothetical protein IPK59_09245 [Rhodospirillaceae bacterium]|nr:hypothetical protein [Rhodospirillaceae bacterium]